MEDLDVSQERSPSTVLNDDGASTPRRPRLGIIVDSPAMSPGMRGRRQTFDVTTMSKKGAMRKTAVFGAGECAEALQRGLSPDDATSAITSQQLPIQETYEEKIARILEINGIADRSQASQKMLSQVD